MNAEQETSGSAPAARNSPVAQKAKTARQRAREEITAEILAAARVRLTNEGPGQLALRAVARDVGMVSSAVYRYYASRDELLTALLIEGYNELGAAAEDADASIADRADFSARWLAVCRSIRVWAIEHPGDYALLYGSPIPGFAAPQDTIGPATRVILLIVGIILDAQAAGAVLPEPPPGTPAPEDAAGVVGGAIDFIRERGLEGETSVDLAVRTLQAWTTIFGTISFELFGHLVGSVSDYPAYFDLVAGRLAADLGLRTA